MHTSGVKKGKKMEFFFLGYHILVSEKLTNVGTFSMPWKSYGLLYTFQTQKHTTKSYNNMKENVMLWNITQRIP
jgi:hypothetical protein